jgi:hypothetical protein
MATLFASLRSLVRPSRSRVHRQRLEGHSLWRRKAGHAQSGSATRLTATDVRDCKTERQVHRFSLHRRGLFGFFTSSTAPVGRLAHQGSRVAGQYAYRSARYDAPLQSAPVGRREWGQGRRSIRAWMPMVAAPTHIRVRRRPARLTMPIRTTTQGPATVRIRADYGSALESARDAHAAAARSGCYGCPDPPAAPYT